MFKLQIVLKNSKPFPGEFETNIIPRAGEIVSLMNSEYKLQERFRVSDTFYVFDEGKKIAFIGIEVEHY